jgi:hypothetical protein
MRILSLAFAVLAVAALSVQSGPEPVYIPAHSPVLTNSTGETTRASAIASGFVESVIVEKSGSAASGKVAVVTSASYGIGLSRTILAERWITSTTEFPVSAAPVTTAGAAISNTDRRIWLWEDMIEATAKSASGTGTTFRVKVILSR